MTLKAKFLKRFVNFSLKDFLISHIKVRVFLRTKFEGHSNIFETCKSSSEMYCIATEGTSNTRNSGN